MSALNNNRSHYKTISNTCYIANIAYLILRIFYLVLFIVSQLYVMVWVTLGKENCLERLETLRKAIEEATFEFEGKTFKITITIGAADYKKDISLEDWVELADKKMYFGKKTGKNQIVY